MLTGVPRQRRGRSENKGVERRLGALDGGSKPQADVHPEPGGAARPSLPGRKPPGGGGQHGTGARGRGPSHPHQIGHVVGRQQGLQELGRDVCVRLAGDLGRGLGCPRRAWLQVLVLIILPKVGLWNQGEQAACLRSPEPQGPEQPGCNPDPPSQRHTALANSLSLSGPQRSSSGRWERTGPLPDDITKPEEYNV